MHTFLLPLVQVKVYKNQLKYLSLLFFISVYKFGVSQIFSRLKTVDFAEGIKPGYSVMYGTFIRDTKGAPIDKTQEIGLYNIDTDHHYTFNAKDHYGFADRNLFIIHLPPGTYQIVDYLFTVRIQTYVQSFTVQPRKDNPSDSVLLMESAKRYTFKIEPDKINYVGTWHYLKGKMWFETEKAETDKKAKKYNGVLDFSKAVFRFPE